MVDPSRCILCGGCVDVCPNDCISLISADGIVGDAPELAAVKNGGAAYALILDERLCVRCGTCVSRCPVDAISMVKYEFLEV
jgi:ferredoxin